MKKIKVDNLILVLENNKLSIIRKELIRRAPQDWIIVKKLETVCEDITQLLEEEEL